MPVGLPMTSVDVLGDCRRPDSARHRGDLVAGHRLDSGAKQHETVESIRADTFAA